jgi:hypothetical protein
MVATTSRPASSQTSQRMGAETFDLNITKTVEYAGAPESAAPDGAGLASGTKRIDAMTEQTLFNEFRLFNFQLSPLREA